MGLYRGMSSPLIGVTPMFAVSFWSYGLGIDLVSSQKDNLSMGQYALAGAFSALPTAVVMTPMERVKVIMQTQDQRNMFHACRSVWREGGLASLYRGTIATLLRVLFLT